MISGVRNTLTALRAFQTKQDSIAHNVANVNTDGYEKTKVIVEEGPDNSVQTLVEKVDDPGPGVSETTARGRELVEKSNVELSEELPRSLLNKRNFQANVKMIEVAEEMTGTLLDVVS